MKMNDVQQIIKGARSISRLTALEVIDGIFEDFIEFHGDRRFGDDPAIVGGIASLDGRPVTIIGTQKGHDVQENVYRNFGSPHPEGYRKAIRLMRQADKFNRPIITFINTAGAFCDVESEERGIGDAISESLLVMSRVKVPLIAIFIGEGGSGGALALAMGNEVWMLENSMYSVLSPEGFASILWKESSRSEEAALVMKLTPNDLLKLEIIDRIIPERRPEELLPDLKTELISSLRKWRRLSPTEIVAQRQERFRKY
ncbi:acetyl-coa carboxylase alpha subunit [Trichococcus pasteurii]|uniref:acetyl-CoA carboxytransferase n=3 Tax=Carnobacteriaceae TaxID=186828 RepID=A0A1W1IH73_9LACT|nr:acetyl-CoA carboxylase carboxyl transferase subunit alpha [Trichococcus pasteurii]SLM52143.1 acetyl-coa carboxylase alpha subunit [Trichococcus pasteurii]SSB93024.1 acetyl-coa carboxylase alpha subunit [Trichococcus pasteurii]SYZ79981.1 acetyl-coa carboxylase alpha subunit [Trichococcus shcherbakoviae]